MVAMALALALGEQTWKKVSDLRDGSYVKRGVAPTTTMEGGR